MKTPPGPRLLTRFLLSPEGRLFLAGCCMLIAWVASVAVLRQQGYESWMAVLTLGLAHMVAGKPVSILQGIQAGMPDWLIVFLATYADIMMLLIIYPILIFGYRNFVEDRFFQKHMRPVFDSAQKGMDRIGHFKILGVFAFVWFPFWMTGVIVGAVLGYLIGMRTWAALLTVSAGTMSAIVCWVLAYDQLTRWLGWIREGIPNSAILLLLLILVWCRLVNKRRRAAGAHGPDPCRRNRNQ